MYGWLVAIPEYTKVREQCIFRRYSTCTCTCIVYVCVCVYTCVHVWMTGSHSNVHVLEVEGVRRQGSWGTAHVRSFCCVHFECACTCM